MKKCCFYTKKLVSWETVEDVLNDELTFSAYHEWFDILIKDDYDEAQDILISSSENDRNKLVNSNFNFGKSKGFESCKKSLTTVTNPFHLAVSYCSYKVSSLLMDYNVNPLKVNRQNDNVLHSCIITATNKPDLEDNICHMIRWLTQNISDEEMKILLFQENSHGLYPLEFAAQQNCVLLMDTIFNMKGHVAYEENYGLYSYQLHDVTMYEVGERYDKSPVSLLAFLDKKILNNAGCTKVLLKSSVGGWIDAKIKSNHFPIFIWFCMRLSIILIYFILDAGTDWLIEQFGERTSKHICQNLSYLKLSHYRIYLTSFVLVYCVISVFRGIYQKIKSVLKKEYWRLNDLNGRKCLLASTKFYHVTHCILTLVILTSGLMTAVIINFKLPFSEVTFLIVDITRTLLPVLCLWSLAYFLQMIPIVGTSIINMQGMLSDVGNFMLTFLIILLPFIHVFQAFSLANSVSGCVPEFSNPFITSYTLFRVMFNMFDVASLDMKNIGVLYAAHVIYVFMVGIILLNFLIALMATSAANIAQQEPVILKINQLALAVELEDRLFCIMKWMYRKLKSCVFVCKENRVYLQSVKSRFEYIYE